MDELSTLVADSIDADEAIAASESASSSIPMPDFTGSLDYIDSLASRSAIAISRRDALAITTGLSSFDYLSPTYTKPVLGPTDRSFLASTDFRPLGDNRSFSPLGSDRALPGLTRDSVRLVAPSRIRNEFPPDYVNPNDPTRSVGDLNRTFRSIERRISRKPFAFNKPNQAVICLKRKIRRNVMFSAGFGGMSTRYMRKPRRTFWSRVIC